MAQLADLLGAVRLPENAHQRAAGTRVVTDLLLFRRREADYEPADDTPTWEQKLAVIRRGASPTCCHDPVSCSSA